jgi:1,4-dihydroxy-2-naphthoate polyprenyltransferase
VALGLSAWLAAARPRTLAAAFVPVIVGLALAARADGAAAPVAVAGGVLDGICPLRRGGLDLPLAALTLATALLIQIATNLANDYFDFAHGADGPGRLGPQRLSATGHAVAIRHAMVGVVVLAAAAGLYLVARGGWPILVIGVASLISAIAYTGGPFPLAYHGLGDVFVFAFFGPVAVGGTYLLQRGVIAPAVLLAAVPVGCLAMAILVVNNLRDVDGDRRVGKRTLAVRIGARATRVQYVGLLAVAFASVVLLGAWLPLLAAPLAAWEGVSLWRRRGAELNASLAGTARLHLVFGLLLAVGIAA